MTWSSTPPSTSSLNARGRRRNADQEKSREKSHLFLRAPAGAQTRSHLSRPTGRGLPTPQRPPNSPYSSPAPPPSTPTGLQRHASLRPVLTCGAPCVPPSRGRGRGSRPRPSCAWVPRSRPARALHDSGSPPNFFLFTSFLSIRTLVDRTATRMLLIFPPIPQITTGGRPRPPQVCCGC